MTARRRRPAPFLAAVTAAVLAAALAGCTAGEDQATPGAGQEVKIGLLAPLSGPQKFAGTEAQRGAQLAADVINGLNPSIPLPLAEGAGLPNYGGARIKILTQNTAGDDPQAAAATAVTRLVSQQGADALVGAFDPQVTEYASQRADRYEVPFVNADSPATFLTDRGLDWFFRLGPSWRSAGEAFFSMLRAQQTDATKPAARNILVLHSDDKAGRDVNTTVQDLAEEGGFGDKLGEIAFPPTATNLVDTVQRVQNANPDVVMIYATPETAQPLIQAFELKQYRPKAVFSFGLGALTPTNYTDNAAAVAGLCRAVSWAKDPADRNQAARAVANLYLRRFNSTMTESAAAAFTAVLTIAEAVDAARSAEPQRIRTALLSLDVPGEQTIMPWGGVQFDETHQNTRAQAVVEQFVRGSFTVVYPGDAASDPFVYPADAARAP